MSLDVNTRRGQETREDEKRLIEQLRHHYNDRGIRIVETPKDREAVLDGFLLYKGQAAACFENKCRYDMDSSKLMWRGSWLITFEKLEKCREVAKSLCVPFVGYLYLVPDNSIYMWKITDSYGNYRFDFKTEVTKTQRTCNGGKIDRLNAYLPVEYATLITNKDK